MMLANGARSSPLSRIWSFQVPLNCCWNLDCSATATCGSFFSSSILLSFISDDDDGWPPWSRSIRSARIRSRSSSSSFSFLSSSCANLMDSSARCCACASSKSSSSSKFKSGTLLAKSGSGVSVAVLVPLRSRLSVSPPPSPSVGAATTFFFFTRRRIFFFGAVATAAAAVPSAAAAVADISDAILLLLDEPSKSKSYPSLRGVWTFTSNGSVSASTLIDRRKENASFSSRCAFRISSNCNCDSKVFSRFAVASAVNVRKFWTNLPTSLTSLYKSDGPNTKYPTSRIVNNSGVPIPSIPPSDPMKEYNPVDRLLLLPPPCPIHLSLYP
mmetsp:Transcript_62876/g.153094  ORF Transcript_62876/g.153094 Transcript_62876/m.153094 type:complete len:328 (+) Transcript_62876:237-1220(+)